MTSSELTAARHALELTQRGLAHRLGVDDRTVRKWEADDRAVPETIARIVRLALVERGLLDRLQAA